MKNQLFIVPTKTILALDIKEVEATAAAMKEFGIYRLPYDKIDLWMDSDFFLRLGKLDHLPDASLLFAAGAIRADDVGEVWTNLHGSCVVEYRDLCLDKPPMRYVRMLPGNPYWEPQIYKYSPLPEGSKEHKLVLDVIIVLLNTRNAVKDRQVNKLAKLGIGGKKAKNGAKSYTYVTTISVPQPHEMEDHDPNHTGKPKRPHLRRGHPRKQNYGPRGSGLYKAIWIEPMFINADADFVDSRERYNVSL